MGLIRLILLLALSMLVQSPAHGANDKACQKRMDVIPASNAKIVVAENAVRDASSPFLFGLNLEWVGFQSGHWDKEQGRVRPEVIKWLKALPGMTYRYPGGTVANHFDWRQATGPQKGRAAQKAVDWRGPLKAEFGVDEFMEFTRRVDGTPWLVANLYGEFGKEQPVGLMAEQQAQWAGQVKSRGVTRWELGNELDRPPYNWPAEKYASAATAVSRAIAEKMPDACFVAMLADYDTRSGLTASQYNRRVVANLPGSISEFARHSYYDGRPGGPPVPDQLHRICDTLDDIRAVRGGAPFGIWVTEHARWPPGRAGEKGWKDEWWRSGNLEAAIAVADFYIGLLQVPEVKGGYLHSLGGTTGPWQLFHENGGTKELYPSAVYWALAVLTRPDRSQILSTTTWSPNHSGYPGGYDVRAAAVGDADGRRFGLLAVNRRPVPTTVEVVFPRLSGKKVRARLESVGGKDIAMRNSDDNQSRVTPVSRVIDVTFDAQGRAGIVLPENSVSSILFW